MCIIFDDDHAKNTWITLKELSRQDDYDLDFEESSCHNGHLHCEDKIGQPSSDAT